MYVDYGLRTVRHVQLAASACKCKCCQCSAENWIDRGSPSSADLVKCAMLVQTADVSLFAIPAPFSCKSLIQIAKATATQAQLLVCSTLVDVLLL